jgi:hypothetical protein
MQPPSVTGLRWLARTIGGKRTHDNARCSSTGLVGYTPEASARPTYMPSDNVQAEMLIRRRTMIVICPPHRLTCEERWQAW